MARLCFIVRRFHRRRQLRIGHITHSGIVGATGVAIHLARDKVGTTFLL
jgi:hypothetical protein